MATYKLSKSGIERLERFKRDIESGEVRIFPEYHFGVVAYYVVENDESITCCFLDEHREVKGDALKQIEKTLSGKIKENEHGLIVSGGLALNESDVELSNA